MFVAKCVKCNLGAVADWNGVQYCVEHFAETLLVALAGGMSEELEEQLKRLTGRYAEAGGHKFDKIANDRIVLEREISTIEAQLKTLDRKTEAEKNEAMRLNALLLKRKRELAGLKG